MDQFRIRHRPVSYWLVLVASTRKGMLSGEGCRICVLLPRGVPGSRKARNPKSVSQFPPEGCFRCSRKLHSLRE